MPIAMNGGTATFSGDCAIEEADAFLEWLRSTADAKVDLSACSHLHAALLQTLLALRPSVSAPPGDPFLARLLTRLPAATAAIPSEP